MLYANPELSEPKEVETITIPLKSLEDLLKAEYFLRCVNGYIGVRTNLDHEDFEKRLEKYRSSVNEFVESYVSLYKDRSIKE